MTNAIAVREIDLVKAQLKAPAWRPSETPQFSDTFIYDLVTGR